MNTPVRKILGVVLITASFALFGWLAYEPAQIVSTFKLGAVADEAAAVVATLAVVASGVASGAFLALRASPTRH